MTMLEGDSDLITASPFYKSSIASTMHLSCGGGEFASEATLWIHGTGERSVRREWNHGTRVWIYKNRSGDIVGFGSLGLTKWEMQTGDYPDENFGEVSLQYIPMLGVFSEFQGCPRGAGPLKYCYQIVDHLIDEGERRKEKYPLLGLSVHPENAIAIHVYTESGFLPVTSSRGYSRMILALT